MRLIDPGPGELIDRLTILELKLATCPRSQEDHFMWEREQIFVLLALRRIPKLDAERRELAEINRTIWDAIDELRGAKDDATAAHFGRLAMQSNDRRAEVIETINRLCGLEGRQEKIL